jgi:ferric-dicitrate binding protein FerR (iron transport regulator)
MTEDQMRFSETLLRYADGELSSNELLVLECELAASAEKRQWFRQFHMQEQRLRGVLKKLEYAEANAMQAGMLPMMQKQRKLSVVWSAAAAVIISLVAVLWMRSMDAPAFEVDSLARVNDFQSVDLQGHDLAFQQGDVRVGYGQGSNVVIQGPAAFEVTENGLALEYGEVLAQVPEMSSFSVEVEGSTISSEAGAFGVRRDAQGTMEVFAFQGEVTLVGKLMLPKTLQAGEVLRYDAQGVAVAPMLESGLVKHESGLKLMYGLENVTGAQFGYSWSESTGARVVPEGVYASNAPIMMVLSDTESFDVKEQKEEVQKSVEGLKGLQSFMLEAPSITNEQIASEHKHTGSVTFETPIVGVIAGGRALSQSDVLVSFAQIPSVTSNRGSVGSRDIVTLSKDRKTLLYELQTSGRVDQMRVIVAKR